MRQRGLLLPVFDNGKSKHRRAVASGGRYNSLAPMMTDDADVAATGRLSNNSNGNHHLLLPNNHHSNNSGAQMTGMASSSSYSTDTLSSLETAPNSLCTNNTIQGHPGDLEFFEDLITEPVLVLGIDISHLSAASQFTVCAVGLFFFSLLYGYLQELLAVELCSRQLGLFLAATQFLGYTVLAYFMRSFVYNRQQLHRKAAFDTTGNNKCLMFDAKHVPFALYLGLSLLRAVDLAMTNLAMQYINYPAKTLMKSSRVVFTMLFGVLIQRKVYKTADYTIVVAMVIGLAMFMHADATSSAIFHHMGVVMLTVSLVCDGAISNMSETIMTQFGVGQDEFIFRLYSISLVAISGAAAVMGDLRSGLFWMMQPGTYQQYLDGIPLEERTWSVMNKLLIMILFSSMGFFGSSCSAAITKNFGALTMSITSTARKAMTLFLSFFLFNNVCTTEHIVGIVIFIVALTTKSLRRRNKTVDKNRRKKDRELKRKQSSYPSSEMVSSLIVNIKPNETTPDQLTYRQRNSSGDGIDVTTMQNNTRSNLVHVV